MTCCTHLNRSGNSTRHFSSTIRDECTYPYSEVSVVSLTDRLVHPSIVDGKHGSDPINIDSSKRDTLLLAKLPSPPQKNHRVLNRIQLCYLPTYFTDPYQSHVRLFRRGVVF